MNYNILLQGFHWDSPDVRKSDGTPRWYQIIEENADRIKNSGFTLVWFPPPSDSVNKHGYEPRELNKLDSEYGSEAELKAAIAIAVPERMRYTLTERSLAAYGLGQLTCTSSE